MPPLDILLSFAATLAAGAAYIIHPDETTQWLAVAAGRAFLAHLRVPTPRAPSPTTPSPSSPPDTYTELPAGGMFPPAS